MILKLPYLSIGQCPIQDPTPLINQKQISNFGQFDGFWSRGWVAYTTPPWGWYRADHSLPESREFGFSKLKWRRTKDRFRSGNMNLSSTRQAQGLDCYWVGCTVVWLRSSGWSAQSPRAVHGLLESLIAFNAELTDESPWFWLTLEQMGFPLRLTGGGEHEERAEVLDNSQRVRVHLVALVPRGACDHWLEFGQKSGLLQQRTWTDTNAAAQWMK